MQSIVSHFSLLLPLMVLFCAPVKDTVLSDVERNYTATGFLDTDTFQILCPISAAREESLASCQQKLIAELVLYKERYDRQAFARRMHADLLPFFQPEEPSAAQREEWRRFFYVLSEGRSRVVFERALGDGFEAVYRLRHKNLVYRIQAAK